MENVTGNELVARLPRRSRTVCAGALLGALAAFALGSVANPATLIVQAAARATIDRTDSAPAPLAPAVPAPVLKPARTSVLKKLTGGMASWYGEMWQNQRTASGRRFDMGQLTAAHRTLPFGSRVKVTDLRNRKSVVVTITDRGIIHHADRVIDLSYAAAAELDMVRAGVDPVSLELLKPLSLASGLVPAHP